MASLEPVKSPELTAAQALTVLEWMFGRSGLKASDMTRTDRGYAEAFLVEMIQKSIDMSLLEALLRKGMKPGTSPKGVIIAFVKGAGKTAIKFKDKDDYEKFLKDPKIYQSVLATLSRNFKSKWHVRLQTGEW